MPKLSMNPNTRPEWLAVGLLPALLSGCPQLASEEFNKVQDTGVSDASSANNSGGFGGIGIDLSTTTAASVGGSSTSASTAQGGSSADAGSSGGSDNTDADADGPDAGSSTDGPPLDAGDSMPPECMQETEVCDGLDNDCDGLVDQARTCEPRCQGFALEGHGYMFCGTPKGVTGATTACRTQGMTLVQIDSEDENDELVDEVKPLFEELAAASTKQEAFWSGASDEASEGDWIWTGSGAPFWQGLGDGAAVGGAFENWDEDKPNEANDLPEDCAAVYLTTAEDGNIGAWNDLPCADAYAFVCEAE